MKDFQYHKCPICENTSYHVCLYGSPSTPPMVVAFEFECDKCGWTGKQDFRKLYEKRY